MVFGSRIYVHMGNKMIKNNVISLNQNNNIVQGHYRLFTDHSTHKLNRHKKELATYYLELIFVVAYLELISIA